MELISAIFLNKYISECTATQNFFSEEVLVILIPGKKVQECHSGQHPSEKEFRKGIPACSITKIPLELIQKTAMECSFVGNDNFLQ
jgi:hypothetical protein